MFKHLIFLSILSTATVAGADSRTDSRNAAGDSYRQYVAPTTGNNINKLTDPMSSGGQMHTLDGSRSFTAGSMNSSGHVALKITAIPNFPTGDIATIKVEQDLDGDGQIDTISTFPATADGSNMISGACSNGYIACTPGTYSNCTYESWTTDAAGAVAAKRENSIQALSNCYCYNNHCSSFQNSVVLNLDSLVSDFGGGVLTAFLSAHHDFSFSSAQASSGSIAYQGIKTNNPNPPTGGPTPATPPTVYSSQTPDVIQSYYPNLSALDSVGQSEATAQKAQPNSVYSMIKKAADNQPGVTLKTCSIDRSVGNKLTDRVYDTTVEGNYQTDNDAWIELSPADGGKYHLQIYGSVPNQVISYPSALRYDGGDIVLPDAPVAENQKITQITQTVTAAGPGCNTVSGTQVWTDGSPYPLKSIFLNFCPGQGLQNPLISTKLGFHYQTQDIEESIANGCSEFEADQNCRLKDEKIDTRDSVFNFMPTGFQMSQVCNDITGPLRTAKICRDWWKKERTYSCTNGTPPYNFNESRFSEAKNSATLTGDTMTYTDGGAAKSYIIGTPPPDPPCEKICKTKVPVSDVVVSSSTTATDVKTAQSVAAAQFSINYRTCTDDAAGNSICPTEPGETVESECACEDQKAFGEAMAGLTAISSIKDDTICSSTPPTHQ